MFVFYEIKKHLLLVYSVHIYFNIEASYSIYKFLFYLRVHRKKERKRDDNLFFLLFCVGFLLFNNNHRASKMCIIMNILLKEHKTDLK